MHELLNPARQNIKGIFDKQFQGMAFENVSLNEMLKKLNVTLGF